MSARLPSLLLVFPTLLAAQQPAPNPSRLVGDWDFWQGSAGQVQAVLHVAADSTGAVLRQRVGGQQLARFVSLRVSGDSAFFELSPTVALAGPLQGDTVRGAVLAQGVPQASIRMVRRPVPTPFAQQYRLWPGPLSDSAFAVALDTAVPMRARDGIRLMNMIARPVGDGPFPVVLDRTPYGRRGQESTARFFAQRGYIYVAQDVRGRWGSDGVFRDLAGQDTDGYDAVEWAAALPGSSGKVGMRGGSYEGETQWYAAVMQPPHLAAIVPIVSPPDPCSTFHTGT
jgi:hypothetical protein